MENNNIEHQARSFGAIVFAVFCGIIALFILIGATSCTKKEQGCYTCKIYSNKGLQDITTICDESQVEPFKNAHKGTGLGVSCQKQ